jgi:hypothetical protein
MQGPFPWSVSGEYLKRGGALHKDYEREASGVGRRVGPLLASTTLVRRVEWAELEDLGRATAAKLAHVHARMMT